jgi:hypothetical protein
MNRVSIMSEMVRMLNEPCIHYHPQCNGVSLLPETGDPQVSVENVRRLLREGQTWLAFIAGTCGVVVVFESGASILATGLRAGGGPKTEALAKLAEEIGLGPATALEHWYSSLGTDYRGILPH